MRSASIADCSPATGAKTASLYQRFSQYGDPVLAPERVIGFDAGINQSFFGGLATAFVSVFANRYTEASCQFQSQAGGNADLRLLFQHSDAQRSRVDFRVKPVPCPALLVFHGSYTFLSARNLDDDEDSIYAGRTLLCAVRVARACGR